MNRLYRALGLVLVGGVFVVPTTIRAQEIFVPTPPPPPLPTTEPMPAPPRSAPISAAQATNGVDFSGYPPRQVIPTAPLPVPPVPAAQPTSGQILPPTGQRCWGFRWLPANCFPYDADRASRQETLHFIFDSSYDFMGRRWERPWPRPSTQPYGTGGWTDYR